MWSIMFLIIRMGYFIFGTPTARCKSAAVMFGLPGCQTVAKLNASQQRQRTLTVKTGADNFHR